MAFDFSKLAGAADLSIEVRSAHGPWFTVTPGAGGGAAEPGPAGAPGGPSWFLRWLQPAVYVRSTVGSWTKAPGGEPEGTTWPMVPIVAGALLLLLVVFAVVGVVSLLRRR